MHGRWAISRILVWLAYLWERGVPAKGTELSAWQITCYYASQWLFELSYRAER